VSLLLDVSGFRYQHFTAWLFMEDKSSLPSNAKPLPFKEQRKRYFLSVGISLKERGGGD